MTLLLRKQNAQDRIEGRKPFGWKDTDYAVLDDETRIGRMYLEQIAGGREMVLVPAGDGRATTKKRHRRYPR